MKEQMIPSGGCVGGGPRQGLLMPAKHHRDSVAQYVETGGMCRSRSSKCKGPEAELAQPTGEGAGSQ